jgi:hypothetical protein
MTLTDELLVHEYEERDRRRQVRHLDRIAAMLTQAYLASVNGPELDEEHDVLTQWLWYRGKLKALHDNGDV